MVQRTDYGGGGSRMMQRRSDPTEPAREERRAAAPTMQSFVDSVLSPFVQCVSPPIQACVSPSSSPWQPRHVPTTTTTPRATSPPTSIHPVTPVSSKSMYVTHQFGENDVLCGKGRSSICHPGNQRFREIVEANKGEYARATRKQKIYLAHSIVDLIRNAQPPGRFLLRDVETGRWYDIGRNRSFEKTSQALREKNNPSVSCGQQNPQQRNFGRPSLIIPRHLEHIYQAPPSVAEYRNPPHSAEGHAPHGMYLYPISSVSSYEMISPCNSNLSESNMSVVVPPPQASPVMSAHQHPAMAPCARPCTPTEDACVASPPLSARVPTSPDSLTTPNVITPPSSVASQSFATSFLFDTPVDGGGYNSNNNNRRGDTTTTIVAPSTVRRNRHASGEDGLAALSAAAFLKLDEIE